MSDSSDHEHEPDPTGNGRPIREPKPINWLGVRQGWHEIDLGPDSPNQPDDSTRLGPDAVLPTSWPAAMRQRGPAKPARAACRGAAAQEAAPPPRHDLLGIQDIQTQPDAEEPEHQPNNQYKAMEGSGCEDCASTEHQTCACDTGSLLCTLCNATGPVEVTCPYALHTFPRRDQPSLTENTEEAGNGLQPLLGEASGGTTGGPGRGQLQRTPRSQSEPRQQGSGRNLDQIRALAEAQAGAKDKTQARAQAVARAAQSQVLAQTQARVQDPTQAHPAAPIDLAAAPTLSLVMPETPKLMPRTTNPIASLGSPKTEGRMGRKVWNVPSAQPLPPGTWILGTMVVEHHDSGRLHL